MMIRNKVSNMQSKLNAISRQNGAAVLLVSIILLVGVTLVVVFAARVGVIDQRIAANEYRHIEAKASSGAALDQATGFLESNKTLYEGTQAGWSDCTALQQTFPCTVGTTSYEKVYSSISGTTISELAYTTSMNNGAESNSYLVFTNSGSVGNILTAVGAGSSVDGTGQAAEKVSYYQGTVFIPGQVPPVMTPNILLNGGFTVVGNPNLNGKSGVPATVWATTVGSSGSWQTCAPGDYKDGTTVCIDDYDAADDWSGCDCDPTTDGYGDPKYYWSYRDAGGERFYDDILNPTVFPFPADVFQFAFGLSKSSMKAFVQEVGVVATDCTGVNFGALSSPWVWITGNCSIGGAVYGSRTDPVVLIVEGDFSVTGNFNFWGLIYGMDDVSLNSNSRVHGSIIAESPSKLSNGGYHQIWDPDVLQNIANDDSNSFLAKLKYSWTSE